MPLFPDLEEAIFIERENRFILRCLHKGEEKKVYMPNPGRLWELLFPGVKILLTPGNRGSKYPYIACAVEKRGSYVPLHTHKTNDLVEYLLMRGLIEELKGYEVVKREVTYKKSRFDFLLKSPEVEELYLEVKSCSLFHREMAMFPDAVSARAQKHLLELSEAVKEGKKGAVLFVVQNDGPHYFLPDYHTDIDFSLSLIDVRDKIDIYAIALKIDEKLSVLPGVRALEIPWSIAEREAADSGCYFIILKLEEDSEIEIGSLQKIGFKRGYYLYVGSAKRNLAKRMARHGRVRKKKHWHLDYLRERAEFIKALPIRTSKGIECELAQALKGIASWEIERFGSSDCSCSSHLFGFAEQPLDNRAFIDLLLDYRMESILK